jgi:hypothetical protein
MEDAKCRGDNLTDDFKNAVSDLSRYKVKEPDNPSSWIPYRAFLDSWGTHVMTSIHFGSKIEVYESLQSNDEDTANILQVKTCLKMHEDLSKISAGVCSNISEVDKRKANSLITTFKPYILGGDDNIRKQISIIYLDDKTPSAQLLNDFISSSDKSNQAIGYTFVPIWKVMQKMNFRNCINDTLEGASISTNCNIIQMAINLEAAFAFDTIDCQTLKAYDNKIYQQFREMSSNSEFKDYQCFAAKTGCTSSSKDCHFNTGGKGCITYGPGALEKGEEYKLSPGNYRTTIQGDKGSTDTYKGINNSCHHGFWGCTCNYDWAGGLPDRALWHTGQL